MSNSHHRRAPRWALALTIAVAALAFSQSAFAANFTSSQITTPGDNSFVQYLPQTPNTLHVEGSVAGGSSNADLVCFYGANSKRILAQNVQVADGGFIVDVSLGQFTQSAPLPYCVLRAVPVGDSGSYPPNLASPFQGPRLGAGRFETYETDGTVNDYHLQQPQPRGLIDYYSAGSCGVAASRLVDPVTLEQSYPLFYCSGYFWGRNGSGSPSPEQELGTRSEIQVDGNNAYLSATAANLYYIDSTHRSSLLDGAPELSITKSVDPATGNVTVNESSALVRCAPDAGAFHTSSNNAAWTTDCTSFAGVGVKLERTTASADGGRRTTMTDVWSSTDGQSHQLSLQYEEGFAGDMSHTSPFFSYSWTGGTKGTPALAGETTSGPSGGAPGTVFIDGDGDGFNGAGYPHGAVTFAPGPDDVHWIYADSTYATGLARFARNVPAGGSVKIVHVYVADPSYEVIADQAAADRDKISPPRISIGNPADGSTVASPDVTISGNASDPGGSVASVTVNGEAAAVAPDGTFSKAVTLAEGENTITAVVRDSAGNEATASAKVTFTRPPATETPGAGGSQADLAAPVLGLSTSRIKLGALLKKGLPVKASCSEACSFKVALTIDRRTAKRIGLAAAAIGGKASSLAAPGSKKVVVKLNRKAKRKLARVKSVRVNVTLTASDAARNAAKKVKVTTIRR